jgi:predicted Zn-dependent protease
MLPLVLGLLFVGAYLVHGCHEGPFGRRQLITLDPKEEAQLGLQAFREVLQKSDVVVDGPIVDAVRRVGRRLADQADNSEFRKEIDLNDARFQWDFRVVRSNQVNAFCLPGGKVVVFTSLLPVCATEAGLATVMGHEIGHALARHGAERMAQEQLAQIGQYAAAASLGDLDPQQQRQVIAILGAGTQFGVLLPFSRKHESEADHIGLLLMARAGYDPQEAIGLWQRMEKLGGGQVPEFSSTHPSHERRIEQLHGWMPAAMAYYDRSEKQPQRPLPGH